MVEPVNPVTDQDQIRLSQILEDMPAQEIDAVNAGIAPAKTEFSGNLFEDMLSKAVDALNGVSQTEMRANDMIDKYLRGEAELHEVMLLQSKSSIMVQLAVTTVNSAVTSFKELTQMQI